MVTDELWDPETLMAKKHKSFRTSSQSAIAILPPCYSHTECVCVRLCVLMMVWAKYHPAIPACRLLKDKSELITHQELPG